MSLPSPAFVGGSRGWCRLECEQARVPVDSALSPEVGCTTIGWMSCLRRPTRPEARHSPTEDTTMLRNHAALWLASLGLALLAVPAGYGQYVYPSGPANPGRGPVYVGQGPASV